MKATFVGPKFVTGLIWVLSLAVLGLVALGIVIPSQQASLNLQLGSSSILELYARFSAGRELVFWMPSLRACLLAVLILWVLFAGWRAWQIWGAREQGTSRQS